MMSVEAITAKARELHKEGEYESAMKCHDEALAMLEKENGKFHIDTADRYRQMGAVMDDAGDFDKAREYFDTAAEILVDVGTNDAKLIQGEIFEVLGNMLYKKEDYHAAIEKFREGLRILMGADGSDAAKVREIEYMLELSQMMAD
jgi:tetratricopeptide (TPR) repeat protein